VLTVLERPFSRNLPRARADGGDRARLLPSPSGASSRAVRP